MTCVIGHWSKRVSRKVIKRIDGAVAESCRIPVEGQAPRKRISRIDGEMLLQPPAVRDVHAIITRPAYGRLQINPSQYRLASGGKSSAQGPRRNFIATRIKEQALGWIDIERLGLM